MGEAKRTSFYQQHTGRNVADVSSPHGEGPTGGAHSFMKRKINFVSDQKAL
jgi:hypothetical protein